MDSLREVKQAESQPLLAEVGKCVWKNTRGSRVGEFCGRAAIHGIYCTMHKQCNPELQNHVSGGNVSQSNPDYDDESVSDVTEKMQRVVIGESSVVEFVVKRKKVIITIE